MRKRPITPNPQDAPHLDEGWLDLERAAVVEVTSEQRDYPVEGCTGRGRIAGLACHRFWYSNHQANLRTSHNDSNALRSPSKKPRQSVPKSSSCDGLRMAGIHFEKSFASSGISVPLTR